MEDAANQVITNAFAESFWLGVAVVLVIGNIGFLVFTVKYFYKQIQAERTKSDSLRDKYEANQKEDLKLLLEVQHAIKELNGSDVKRVLSEINIKIERILLTVTTRQ